MDWSIKQTVKKLGVSSRALRYYETRGMLQPRKIGGIRYFDEVQRERILQILRGKQLGFSLTEIKGLLDRSGDDSASAKTQAFLDAQIRFLNQKKAEIEDALSQLAELRASGGAAPAQLFAKADPGFSATKSRTLLSNVHRVTEFTGKRLAALAK